MTPQSNFMILAPVDPAHEAELRRLLDSMNDGPGRVNRNNELVPFEQFDRLHFARLIILDDKTTADVGVYGLPTRAYPLYLASDAVLGLAEIKETDPDPASSPASTRRLSPQCDGRRS